MLLPVYEPMSESDREEVVKLLSELFASHFRRKAMAGGEDGKNPENERTEQSA